MYYISINKIHNTVRKYNDLCVEIKYNNQKRQTTTIWNNDLPIWNEKFVIDLENNINYFTIIIYEKNIWTSTQKLHEQKIKINTDNIQTFKYKYLEISHGKIFHNEITNIKKKYEKILKENKIKQEENNYLNEKVESLKQKLITSHNNYIKLKQTNENLKVTMVKIKDLCNYKTY